MSQHHDVAEQVRDNGYAIVEGVLHRTELDVLEEQISPYLRNTDPDNQSKFFGSKTKRFGRLLHRIPYSRTLVRHPLVLGVCDELLLPFCARYQLHFTGVMHVDPGETAQVLHRDIVPFTNPSPPLTVATMWALSDFTRENGATVLVPGSNHWRWARAPKKEELIAAEMPAGSVLIYAGNVIHGAGSNKSEDSRIGMSLQYTLGWLRQEENQYLAVPQEQARTFDEDLQALMGYELAQRTWGYVDQSHPLDFLNGRDRVGNLAPDYLNDHDSCNLGFQIDYDTDSTRYGVTLDTDDEKV